MNDDFCWIFKNEFLNKIYLVEWFICGLIEWTPFKSKVLVVQISHTGGVGYEYGKYNINLNNATTLPSAEIWSAS